MCLNKLPNRRALIEEWVKGKNILHLGCVDHSWKSEKNDEWIHGILEKLSRKTVGIDILREDITKLREIGYDVRYGNAQHFDIEEKFEVIFIGELLEHLDNFRGFFNCCKKHMNPETVLIFSTPNSFGIRYFLNNLLKRANFNPEHTCWFDFNTFKQLAERFDFHIISFKFISLDVEYLRGLPRITINLLETIFPQLAPGLFFVLKQKS